MNLQLQSMLGLIVLPLIAWLFCENRRSLNGLQVLRLVAAGIGLQLAIGGLMLNIGAVRAAFVWPAKMVAALQAATTEGMRLVFGYLAGGPAPFDIANPQHGFVLAFQALPIILLMSVLSRLFYHWGVLQRIVALFAFLLHRTLGIGGPVGMAAAANIFVGMVEAPLLIRPYIARLSRGGLFAVMTVGMATIAGTVLVLYASLLSKSVSGVAGHLIVASVISAPAALMLAQLMVPDQPSTEQETFSSAAISDRGATSSMDAIALGTRDGIALLANVIAMLVVMIALIALINQLLAFASAPFGATLRLEQIAGYAFAPFAFLIGVPFNESLAAGELLGIKTIANELLAYLKLGGEAGQGLSERSRLIMTYALCGFANFGSLGILIGGLATIAPDRRGEIAALGLKSIVAGTMATLMTGAVVGVLTPG